MNIGDTVKFKWGDEMQTGVVERIRKGANPIVVESDGIRYAVSSTSIK